MSSITKALLASSPAERQWCEDQITVNMYARRFLCGNSRVLVVDGGSDGMAGYLADTWPDHSELRSIVAERGWRVIVGADLFTARDNPRPYKAPKPEPAPVAVAHVAAECPDVWCGWEVCHGMR